MTEATEIKTTEENVELVANEATDSAQEGSGASDGATASESGGGFGLSRGNLIMVALLLVQAGLAAYMLWPSSTVGEAGTPLLGEIDASAVTAMTIVEGDNEIGFEKLGSDWAISGTNGFTTNEDSDDTNKVVAVLDKLLTIDGNRLVTKTPSSHKRLQVAADDFVRKVTIATGDGEQTLYIGSSAGSGATHVRLDGSDEAYLTNQINSFELNTGASSWIDTQYFSVESNDVTAFTLENKNGTFVFERGEPETEGTPGLWTMADLPDGRELDQTKVNTMVNQATNIRMTAPIGTESDSAYGLDDAVATATFTVVESGEDANPEPQTVTVRIGGTPDDSTDYFAKASTSDYIVQISQFNGNQILDKTQEDFLVELDEEEAAAEPADSAAAEPIFNAFPLTDTLPITGTGATFSVTEESELTESSGITVTETVTETATE